MKPTAKNIIGMLKAILPTMLINFVIFLALAIVGTAVTRSLFSDPDFSVLAGLFLGAYFVQFKLNFVRVAYVPVDPEADADAPTDNR